MQVKVRNSTFADKIAVRDNCSSQKNIASGDIEIASEGLFQKDIEDYNIARSESDVTCIIKNNSASSETSDIIITSCYNLPVETSNISPSKSGANEYIKSQDNAFISQKATIQGKRYSQSKATHSMLHTSCGLSNISNSQNRDTMFQESAADSFLPSQKPYIQGKNLFPQRDALDSKMPTFGVLSNISNSQNRDTMFQESAADSITNVLKSASINDDAMLLFISYLRTVDEVFSQGQQTVDRYQIALLCSERPLTRQQLSQMTNPHANLSDKKASSCTNCNCQNNKENSWSKVQCSLCLQWSHSACMGHFTETKECTSFQIGFKPPLCIECRFQPSSDQIEKISDVFVMRRALFTLIHTSPSSIKEFAAYMDIEISFAKQLRNRVEGNL
jgi:hypothetical protein